MHTPYQTRYLQTGGFGIDNSIFNQTTQIELYIPGTLMQPYMYIIRYRVITRRY